MEDSFQSGPNSVTKTRFRNKILRTLFPFPPYLPTSGGNIPSPRHQVPTMLLRAVWGGDVSRARGGGGEEECDRATGHSRVAQPAPRRRQPPSPGSGPHARFPAQAQWKAMAPAIELPISRHLFETNIAHKYTSHSLEQFYTPQPTHTPPGHLTVSPTPHRRPHLQDSNLPPIVKETRRQELGSCQRLSMTAPHKLPHPRRCDRVTH